MNNNSNTSLNQWRHLVLLMISTGARQGELLSLRWHQNDSGRKIN